MSDVLLPEPFNKIESIHTRAIQLSAGETLFLQGDSTKGLYYLMVGAVDLTRDTLNGHNVIVHRAREKEMFAEASLFSNAYHCTATAVKDSKIIECSRSIVDELLRNDIEFTRYVATRFAIQIQEGRRRVELLSIRSADERILAAFNDGLLIDDIAKFADVIGLAQETVYRALNRLVKARKVVKTARGQYQAVEVNKH